MPKLANRSLAYIYLTRFNALYKYEESRKKIKLCNKFQTTYFRFRKTPFEWDFKSKVHVFSQHTVQIKKIKAYCFSIQDKY